MRIQIVVKSSDPARNVEVETARYYLPDERDSSPLGRLSREQAEEFRRVADLRGRRRARANRRSLAGTIRVRRSTAPIRAWWFTGLLLPHRLLGRPVEDRQRAGNSGPG